MIDQHHEGQHAPHGHPQGRQIGHAQAPCAPRHEQARDGAHAEARHAQQQLARGAVEVDRKALRVRQRPRSLGIEVKRQHAAGLRRNLVGGKAIEAQQPVGLVQPVLAQQRRRLRGQRGRGVRDGAEGRVVHALEAIRAVQLRAGGEDGGVVRAIGADDHLRALAGGGKGGRVGAAGAGAGQQADRLGLLLALLRLGVVNRQAQRRHAAANAAAVFFRRQLRQAGLRGQLDVDREPIGPAPGLRQQIGRGVGDGLQVDVAAKVVHLAQRAGHAHQLLHGVVGALDDAAGEKQPFDAVAAVEVEREGHHFFDRKARTLHVAAAAVDAVRAVVQAEVGEQDFEQRDAAPVGRKAVADAGAFVAADAALAPARARRIAPRAAAGGAAGVVLGGIGQNSELGGKFHCSNVQLLKAPVLGF